MRLNFFAKLVILVLSLTLTSTGITGFILLNALENNQKANIDHQVQEQVNTLSRTIEAMLEEKIKLGQMIAGHAKVVQGDGAGIQELLTTIGNGDSDSYEMIILTNKEGQVTNATLANSAAKMVGMSIADRQYFKDAMQSGKTVIGDVLISRNSGKPVIVISSPIKDGAGQFSGVAAQVVTLDALERLRSQVKIGETGFASVVTNVNGKAITIAHQDKTFVAEQKDLSGVSIVKATMGGEKQLMSFRAASGTDMIGATDIVNSTKWIVTAMVPEQEVYAPIISSRYKMLGVISVTLLLVIFLTWYFARKLASRLSTMVQRVTQVTKGDLRAYEITDISTDEIGQLGTAIHAMTENLRSVIRQVTHSAEQVAASSEQLKTGAEQSAQGASQVAISIMEVVAGTEKQISTVDKTASVVERISEEIEQAVTNVNIVDTASDKAAGVAKDGGKAVEAAIHQMGIIEDKVSRSSQVVIKLGERSQEIGQIVDTIAGIAGQTNLLALNAAIEAARAGEQGRGFAVVAEEVRKLAEQSQEATKQIASLISEIQGDTENAVVAMNEGTHEVKIGAEVVDTTGRAFSEIVSAVAQVSEQITHISAGIQEIKEGSQEIVSAVQEIGSIGQDNASQTQTVSAVTEEQSASMEEIAAASNSLAEMAQELQQVVKQFIV